MSGTLTEEKTESQTALSTPWQVVVLDDPVNLMAYVVLVFRKVFGFATPKATRHMLEVHEKGRSILWQGAREQAELYVQLLQQWQLTTKLERSNA